MKKATRLSFGEELAAIGDQFPAIVVLDADLSKSTQSQYFARKYPARFFEMGIQEHNMISTAAGMALMGKNPFICSFAAFVTGRFEAIRMSVAYMDAPVKIVGTHCGIGIGEDGYSQMAAEDIAVMRSLANMSVIQPADDAEARAAVRFLAGYPHPAYLRLTRQAVEDVHDESYKFEFGKADVLRDGKDVAVFCTGGIVSNTIHAVQALAGEGIDARVINIHTIKPLDADAVVKAARECGRVVTIEDHSIIGGLGGAVAEVLAEHAPTKMKRIGVQDVFGESGTPEDLYRKYRFDAGGLASQILEFMKS
jgi:transketolase